MHMFNTNMHNQLVPPIFYSMFFPFLGKILNEESSIEKKRFSEKAMTWCRASAELPRDTDAVIINSTMFAETLITGCIDNALKYGEANKNNMG